MLSINTTLNYKQRSDDQLRFKGSLHMNIRKYH